MQFLSKLGLILAALSASPAYAQCVQWDLSGRALRVSQDNGFELQFQIRQDGERLTGTAYNPRNPDPEYSDTGRLEGSLRGNHVWLRIQWLAVRYDVQLPWQAPPQDRIGIYHIYISEDGRLSGYTETTNPYSRANVFGRSRLQCAFAPGKAVGQIGEDSAIATPPQAVGQIGEDSVFSDPMARPDAGSVVDRDAAVPNSNRCASGFVWRVARPSDLVCVPPESRARVAAENARAPTLWTDGPFGRQTCVSGFVWRDAFPGDLVCVTPEVREMTRRENQMRDSRLAR